MEDENQSQGTTFKNTFSYKLIYVFAIADNAHEGSVKIGDTKLDTDLTQDRLQPNCRELNQAAITRINSYTKTAGVTATLIHTELAIRTIQKKDGSWNTESFRDYDVHRVLLNSGIKKKTFGGERLGNEWFCCDSITAIKAITAVKHGDIAIDTLIPMEKFIPITFRPEQNEAIEKTIKQFRKSPRMLWNAKMRFGKTLSALEVIHRMNFERTVLITHRPVVDDGWHEDFEKIFAKEDKFRYGSKKSGIEITDLEKTFKRDGKHYIYFASIQDLRGSKIVGGKFEKNDEVFDIDWDCVIIDEAHEGTTTELGDKVKGILFKPEKGTKLLELSGTPFNILSNYEDDDDSVFTWDYVMEQQAKQKWEETHFGDSNPYADLPEMRMYTYDLGKLIKGDFVDVGDKAFNFTEFFRTNDDGSFKYENSVNDFLNLLTKQDKESLYPFSCKEYINLFHHTLWMVPGVKEALALQHLLESHEIFGTFKVVNVAGDGDPEDPTGEALEAVRDAIKEAGDDGYTITLSCGKLTTGVSVKQWTAVFMLYGSYTTKAAGYLQTIFRVQTPCNDYGKAKTQAYVFDFAPDRTLKMVADAVTLNTKVGKTKLDDKIRLGEFLNFCPVIGLEGSTMKPYKVNSLLQQLKASYAERAVTKGFDDTSIYNDELLKLSKVELQKFKDLQAIIGQTKANKKSNEIDINKQGLTNEEYEELSKPKPPKERRELTPEEEAERQRLLEAKKQRQTAISILRGISIRMPLLIYGARGKNGDEIPITEDITLKKFVELVDETSWEEFMPRGVTKENFADFEKYYDEDVFIAAGKRIRNLVLAADKLNVTERVRKIAEIFSYFRNPDKETVLTPWRVVNMHMGDCLGGWSFFDSNYEKSLKENEAPHFIDIEGITARTLGNSEAKILEINSKTGLYPLYCAYSIFRSKQSLHPQMAEHLLWEETIKENIFVICKTPMAKAITQRTLCGFENIKTNAHAFDHLVNDLKNKSDTFIKDITSNNFWKKGTGKMEFDAIVGNPPYQETVKMATTGNNANTVDIYPYFRNIALTVCNIVSLIYPAKELQRGISNTLDKSLIKVRIYNGSDKEGEKNIPGEPAVFGSAVRRIPGDVGIFLWDKGHPKEKINYQDVNIERTDKILPVRKDFFNLAKRLESYAGKSKNYNIRKCCESNFVENNPDSVLSVIKDRKADTPKGYSKVITNDKAGSGGKARWYYIKTDDLDFIQPKVYKVVISSAFPNEAFKNPNNLEILNNDEMFGRTKKCIYYSKNIEDVKNYIKYMSTNFVKTIAQMTPYSFMYYLPDFNMIKNDIDWNGTIPEMDIQLYEKFGLSDEEIIFIGKIS